MSLTTKNTKSKFHKAAVLGAAGLMCLSFTPVTAFQALADYVGDTANSIGTETIRIEKAETTVNRGNPYSVKHAYFGNLAGDKAIHLGMGDSYYDGKISANGYTGLNGEAITDITSKVVVTYSTGEVIQEFKTATTLEDDLGSFTAHNVGEYTISYEITVTYGSDDSAVVRTYETELVVKSQASKATLGFASDAAVVPSVYDKALAAKSPNKNKDIELPKPLVYADKESEKGSDEYTTIFQASELADGQNSVLVTISGTSNGTITLSEDAGKIFIPKAELNAKAGNGDNITIKYSYYTGKNFVASVSKQMTVYSDYYAEDGKEYSLTATHTTMNAVTKVASKLATVKAYTNKDLKEEVEVSVSAKAYRKNSSGNYADHQADAIADGEFTPWADGDYKIVFTVTDAYGYTATTEEYIFGVKDTDKPVVYMYDANDTANNRAESKFVSAETKLKSKTTEGNVIIYAIGAKDNVNTAEEMNKKYKRTIKSSSRTIEVTGYNAYNLIFDSNLETLVKNNYALKVEVEKDLTSSYSEDQLKTWLKEHKYLLVTNTETEGYDEEDYIAAGLAYIDVTYTGTLLIGSTSGTAYTVSYVASDLAGNTSATVAYTISITSDEKYVDDIAPTIKLNSSFKMYYSKKDVITFSAPTISDQPDAYLNEKISYQYYKANGQTLGDEIVFEDAKYEINIAEDFDALLAEHVEVNGAGSETSFEAPAYLILSVFAEDDYGNKTTKTEKINIIEVNDTKAPTIVRESYVTASTGAKQNQEITLPTVVYSDDNAGFISSDVQVRHVGKDKDGNIVKVDVESTGKKETAVTNRPYQTYTLNAGSFIASYAGTYEAVVTIKDYNGNYVVTYYYYDVDANVDKDSFMVSTTLDKSKTIETGEELTLPRPTVSTSLTKEDGYTIYGIASDDSQKATDYRVVVKNTNNPDDWDINYNETFVGYNFADYQYALAYEVNLHIIKSSLTQTNGFVVTEGNGVYLEISGKKYYMNKLTNDKDHDGDYLLVNYNDYGIAHMLYGAINGTDVTFYNLDTAMTTGDDFASYITDTDSNKYYPEIVNDKLVFVARNASENDYFTMAIEDGKFVFTGNGAVASKTVEAKILPSAESMILTSTNDYIVTTRTSDLHYITVGDNKAPELSANYVYPETAEKGAKIEIAPINAVDSSAFMGMASGIDSEASYVEIAFSGRTSSGAQTSYNPQFYMNKWTSYKPEYDGTKFTYALSDTNTGVYTITYHIKDKAGNEIAIAEGSTQFKIKVGDVTSPTLTLKDSLVKATYKAGDKLVLDFGKIKMSDTVTTDVNKLMETLSVKLKNTTTNTEVKNQGQGKVWNNAKNKYDCEFEFNLEEVGTYELEIKINDESYNYKTETISFEVEAKAGDPNVVSTVVGIVLIVVSVLVLAGVVTYFVVSKVKLDKELGGKSKSKKK